MAIDYELKPGQMVGEYRVERKIGEGGFGKVYAAVHPVIGKAAAIKILNPDLAKNEQMVSRFISEARAVNQIRHRNIIDIFSFGTLPGPLHYFVMEMLEGETLDSYLEKNGAVEPGLAFSLLWPIGRALIAAHKAGITHRDLKPENVFLTVDPDGGVFPKLLDFGIAKLLHESEMAHRTRTGAMLGTPVYMSPEQCRGGHIDHRSDIYSFGIMVHEVLTGKRPFDGESLMDLLMKQVSQPAPPMSRSRPGLPASLDAAVLHMLEKAPESRPESMQAALDELARGAEAAGIPVPGGSARGSLVGAAPGRSGVGTPSPSQATGPAKQPSGPGAQASSSGLDTNAWLQHQAGMPPGATAQTGNSGASPARTGPGMTPSGGGQSPVGGGAAPAPQMTFPATQPSAGPQPQAMTPGHAQGLSPQPGPFAEGPQPTPAGGAWPGHTQPAFGSSGPGYPSVAGQGTGPGYPAGPGQGMTQVAPPKKGASPIGIIAAVVAAVLFLSFGGLFAIFMYAAGSVDPDSGEVVPPPLGAAVEHQSTGNLLMTLTVPGKPSTASSVTLHSHRRYRVTPKSAGASRAGSADVTYFEDTIQTKGEDGSDETESNPTSNRTFSVAGSGGALTITAADGQAVDEETRRMIARDVGPYFDPLPSGFSRKLTAGDAITPTSDEVVRLLGLADPTEGVKVRADNASFKLKTLTGDRALFEVTFLYVYDDEHIHISAPLTGTVTLDMKLGVMVSGAVNGPVEGKFQNEKGRFNVTGNVTMEAR